MPSLVKSTEQIRKSLLEKLTVDLPDFLWVPGELQVDILDAVAEFHYERERIVELFTSMRNLSGFKRLVDDYIYRQEMSEILGLSLKVRTPSSVFIGVPSSVTNDFDVFIFYYLDRFAERYGRKRGRGSSASGLFSMNYTPGIVGKARLVLSYSGMSYTSTVNLDGSGVYSGTLFSFGYGEKFNVKAGNLSISLVISDVLTVENIFNFKSSNLIGGTDYQSNESFIKALDGRLNIFSGPLSINAISTVIQKIKTVDKFLITKASASYRFKGSTNVFLKGGIQSEQKVVRTVGTDSKILIPLQPSEILEITKLGAVIPETEYTIVTPDPDTEYYNSAKQMVWVEFAGSLVFPGDMVELSLLVDLTIQDVHTQLMSHYSSYNETARDVVVYKAQPQQVNVYTEIMTYRNLPYDEVKREVKKVLIEKIGGLDIQEELQADDLRLELRKLLCRGELMIDAVVKLDIGLPGEPLLDQNLSLGRGEFWVLSELDVEVL